MALSVLLEAGHRDAEVEQLERAVRRPEEVLRLDVGVDDARLVDDLEGVEEETADLDHALGVEPPLAAERGAHRLAVQQFHDQERRPVFGDVVVDDADDARMTDPARHEALAEEPLADLEQEAQIGVEQLDRPAAPVPVCRRVDARRAAHAEQPVEAPFATQELADARVERNRVSLR
ncbi:MAG: hypothetical protein JNL21_40515 [Myxococcales bacterium]|nr:hypothetical protein [Myxococcales bacterium]